MLRDRVLQLIERLNDPKPEARDEAEARLIKLGARALPLLPDPASVTSKVRKERLEKVRARLRHAEEETSTVASRVTIQAKAIRLSEALGLIQKQTGNGITDLREQLGGETTNPAFDLDIHDVPFHEALDRVARLAEVSVSAFDGRRHDRHHGGNAIEGSAHSVRRPVPRRLQAVYRGARPPGRNLGGQRRARGRMGPRLRPMLLNLKADGLTVKDDQKRGQTPGHEESNQVVVRPENPAAEINMNLEAPERAAVKIRALE